MAGPPRLHDLACVVHVHSTYSDGTGTVPEIAAAGRRAGVDVVLLTDHDTLAARRRGEEGWYGSTLLLAGHEASPRGGNHLLAFGLDREIDHRGRSAAEVCAAVAEAGGLAFLAHPFSKGSERFRRPGMPWDDLDCAAYAGIELWSFVTDTLERAEGIRDLARFIARPERVVDHPPKRNLEEWDRLCATRRVVAIGGLDAHQVGKRVGGRVVRLMGYARSFRFLRTHALCEEAPSGDPARDGAEVLSALRSGRCYLAMDSLAPARGFAFWASDSRGGTVPMGAEAAAGSWTLSARTPRAAALRLLRDGQEVARRRGPDIELQVEEPGTYRVEAYLSAHGARRTWILSNPIYLR